MDGDSNKQEYVVLVVEAGASTADKILADMSDDSDCDAIAESFDTSQGTYHVLSIDEARQVRDALTRAIDGVVLSDDDWRVTED